MKERFGQMKGISQIFGFLYDIDEFAKEQRLKVFEHCPKLASALEYNGRSDNCALGLTD